MRDEALKSEVPKNNESVWLATTPDTDYPALTRSLSVDVVVIGAGIAGITTAILLQEQGLSVAVIEARKIVQGVTGYTTAKITSLHDLIYDYLITNFGKEKAQMYADANQTAIKKIDHLINTYKIDCDFVRKTAYTYTTKESYRKDIEKEVKAAQTLGLPAIFKQTTPLPFPIKGAIAFSHQAQFHPRKYLLALAKTIHQKKSYLFEHTRAQSIDESGKKVIVKTEKGTVTADYAVIATHSPFLDKGQFYTRMIQQRSYVLGITLKEPPPPDMYISIEEPFHSFRYQDTKEGKIFFVGGEDHKAGQGGDTWKRYERLVAFAQKHFPIKKIQYRWSTQDNMPADKAPYIGKWPLSKRMYVATGFNGWGMTNGTVAAIILTDMIIGKKNAWAPLFDTSRIKPVTSGKKLVKENIDTGVHLIKDHLKKPKAEKIEKLPKGEGTVIGKGLQKIAIYRDEKGKITSVSAVCTHLGCIVGWNSAEKTWDCPCHGSRFGAKGSVIEGPANKDLKRITVSDE